MNDTLIHYIIELFIAVVSGVFILKLTRQSDKTDQGIQKAELIATRLAVIETKVDAAEAKVALAKVSALESKVAVIESQITNEIHLLDKLDNKLDELRDRL